MLPVEHEDLDVLAGQIASQQLGQGGLGLLHELPRHRRPTRRTGAVGDGFADMFGDPGPPAGRDPGEHPLQHHLL